MYLHGVACAFAVKKTQNIIKWEYILYSTNIWLMFEDQYLVVYLHEVVCDFAVKKAEYYKMGILQIFD